jgi:hypothetical protein
MFFKYVVRQENEPGAKSSRFSSKAGYARGLYPNNLKNWEFGEEKPTLPKTNSSSCLGILPMTGLEPAPYC